MIKDYFVIPWKEIRRRKLRSWLTLIGVFIGIAAIVSLITLGQGLQNAIEGQFESLGKDKLFITPKGGTFGGLGSSVKLTSDDIDVVRDVNGIKLVTGMGYTSGRYEFNDIVRYNYVMGISTVPEERALTGESQSWKLAAGRMIQKGDNLKIVLGWAYTQTDLFDKKLGIGDKILLNDRKFEIVGFLEKIGSPPDDASGIIPIDTFASIYDQKDDFGYVIAQTDKGEDPSQVAEDVKKELRKSRDVKEDEEDFDIQTPEQLLSSFGDILNIVQIVLIGIAAISLLVGGVGIMNTMYTSVLQRTKEIGVMKAIGARNENILLLILVESGFYGLGGGLVGVTIGIIIAKLVEFAFIYAVGPAFLVITIDPLLILGTLLFSFLAGVLSGLAPAYRASKLNPVDSLRYE